MATIYCPHCGKEMFEGLDTCPHCGGPVISEARKKEIDKEIENINKKEKKWFIGSAIAGILLPILMVTSMEGVGFGMILLMAYIYVTGFYGIHFFRPIKRFKNNGIVMFILFGWVVFLIYLYIGVFGGVFCWGPRAIIRFFTHKPLLSEKDIQKLVDKELI